PKDVNSPIFHTFVCAAFLINFKRLILSECSFQDLMLRLQNLPTSDWTFNSIDCLTSEAQKLLLIFGDLFIDNLNSI
ncbi:MAG: hypothetical protein MHPSP_004712, partial [Paramarteilia canceri]